MNLVEEKYIFDHLKGRKAAKIRRVNTNSRVVELIQEKLLPLNRERYEHLQKINKALRNDRQPMKLPEMSTYCSSHSPLKKKIQTTRPASRQSSAEEDLLLNRLHSLTKNISNSSQLTFQKNPSVVELEMPPDEEMASTWQRSTRDGTRWGKKKEPLIDLVMRAQQHLRVRKRQLKQRYTERMGGRGGESKGSGLQGVLSAWSLKGKEGGCYEQQMQRELLRDIRLGMLQDKINKMKRDINHKKIVQLR